MKLIVNTSLQLNNFHAFESVMSLQESNKLNKIIIALTNHLNNNKVDYTLIFGSLLEYARHNMLFPWDDDFDFLIHENYTNIFKLLNKLEHIKSAPWCKRSLTYNESINHDPYNCIKYKRCCNFKLNNDLVLTWKPTGCPFKITNITSAYPCVDIYTYNIQQNKLFIPNNLNNGHVRHFEVPYSYIYPTKIINFMGMNMNVPINIDGVLSSSYGKNWPITCTITFNHKGKRYFYENNITYDTLEFPCSLMPPEYRNGLYFNGRGIDRFNNK